jgi:hypothetical protein
VNDSSLKAKLWRIALLCLGLSAGLFALLWLRAACSPRFLEPGARFETRAPGPGSGAELPRVPVTETPEPADAEAPPTPGKAVEGRRITGIVLDPERRAVRQARLVVRSSKRELQLFAGLDGRFEIPCEDLDPRDVIALDPEQRLREAVHRGVRPGTAGLELELRPAPELEVRVVSREGVPIERFALVVLAVERNLPLAFHAEAERPGGLAVVGVPGQDFRLEVRADGWLPARSEVFEAETHPARVELRLAPAGGVRGRVTAAGEPVGAARVTLHAAADPGATFHGFPLRLRRESVADGESDDEGFFALSVAEPGAYHLLVDAPGFALAERGPLALSPEAVCEELVALDAGGRLEVRVHASDPAAAAGVCVAFSRGDGGAFSELTDEHGRIALELLTAGAWQVERVEAELGPGSADTPARVPGAEQTSPYVVRAGETTRIDLWLDE